MEQIHSTHASFRALSGRSTRALWVVTDVQIGGTPLQIYRPVAAWLELGIEVHVVCLAEGDPGADKIRARNVPVSPSGIS